MRGDGENNKVKMSFKISTKLSSTPLRRGVVLLYTFSDRYSIFKLLRSQEIDSKESISPAYVAWRAGTNKFVPNRFLDPIDCSKIPAQDGTKESLLQGKIINDFYLP
jgi:hypothetical protein